MTIGPDPMSRIEERSVRLGTSGLPAGLVAAGLLQDPVLLTDQSLQCRWRFAPTPEGFAAAVTLPGDA